MGMARWFVALGALMLLAPAAEGQRPQRRDGFWIGFGLGYGTANVSCDGCASGSRMGGGTAFVKLGGTLSRNVLLGAALNVWGHSSGGATETMGNVTGSVYFYPSAASGLFLTGGLGFSGYDVDTSPEVSSSGWGFTGGLGYDLRVARNVSLTPVVNFQFGALEDFDVPAGRATGWKQNVIELGLGVTFH